MNVSSNALNQSIATFEDSSFKISKSTTQKYSAGDQLFSVQNSKLPGQTQHDTIVTGENPTDNLLNATIQQKQSFHSFSFNAKLLKIQDKLLGELIDLIG